MEAGDSIISGAGTPEDITALIARLEAVVENAKVKGKEK